MSHRTVLSPQDSKPLTGTLALSFGASVGIQLLNVLTGILLARALGPEGRGALAAVVIWPTLLASLGSLGLAEAISYHAARGTGSRGTLVGTSLLLATLCSSALVVIGAILLPLVLDTNLADGYLLLLYIPLSLSSLYLMGILNGLRAFRSFQALRVLVIGGNSVGIAACAATNALSVHSAVLVYLASHAVTLTVAAVLLARQIHEPIELRTNLLREIWSYGIRSQLSSSSAFLNQRVDQLIISIALAPVKLGLYVVAVTLTSATSLIGSSVSYVALPVIAGLDDQAERAKAAAEFLGLTIVLSAVITAPLMIFTPQLIELLFGPEFLEASLVSRLLLLGSIVWTTTRVLEAILKAIGRPLDAGLAESLALAATLLGLAALLPTLGLAGAALASLLAYSVSLTWMVRRVSGALAVPILFLVPQPQEILRAGRRLFATRPRR